MKKTKNLIMMACLGLAGMLFIAARGTEAYSNESTAKVSASLAIAAAPSTEAEAATTPASVASTELSTTGSTTVADAHKPSLKEKIAARAAERMVKRQMKVNDPGKTASKSQLVALLLCFFIGVLGIHRFYLGYTGIGVLMLLTGGVCGILTLIDFIRIIMGTLKPRGGEYDETL